MTGTETDNAGSAHSSAPKTSEEIARSLRLHPERPPVTRLSRKVLAGGRALALLLVAAAVLWALQNNRTRMSVPEELYSTDHHNVADGLARLPRDYTGTPRDVPRLGPPLPGDLGRPSLRLKSVRIACGRCRATANEPGKRGRAHQQGTRKQTSHEFPVTSGVPKDVAPDGPQDRRISGVLLAPDHSALVLEARDSAARRIFVTSHRIGIAGRPMIIIPALAAVRESRIEVGLFYGRPTGALSKVDAAGLTRELAKQGIGFRPIHQPRLMRRSWLGTTTIWPSPVRIGFPRILRKSLA